MTTDASRAVREALIDKAIREFNENPPFEYFYGHKWPYRARRPILATDCDYEIVSISGVQGKRLATTPDTAIVRSKT